LLTCHQLQIAEIGASDQRSLQLAAVGNTIVEGDTFVAKADRLTYDQGKDQLVFEGLGHNLAVLQQRNRAGQQPLEFQARKIMYWIRDGNVEVFDARQLDYNQIGSPSLPNARIR
jgi:hypothetical protein